MTKEDKEELIRSHVYVIERDFGKHSNTFRLSKRLMTVEVDNYHVTLGDVPSKHWCTCPGMARQQFPREEHKHVKIAVDFVDRGLEMASYRLEGTGRAAEIVFIGEGDQS